mgnify:CR=1 FL=1
MPGNRIVDFSAFYNSECITVSLSMSTWLAIVIFVALITLAIIKYRRFLHYNKVALRKIVLNLPGGRAEFEVERNHHNLEIAHKILIELITRKAAIPIEEDKDVITEVYDSWYALFCTTRDEIKLISGELLKHPKSKALVEMATDVLNKGLRPHLTEYQARFRRWYGVELEKEENIGLSPQKVQRKFSDYDELIASIEQVNELLIQYANELKKFIYS